jgi:hypothetical protein
MIWMGLGTIPTVGGINRLSFVMGSAGQAMLEPPDEAPNKVDKETRILESPCRGNHKEITPVDTNHRK